MKATSNLQLIALAYLSQTQGKSITLYELMIEINHVFAATDTPYSPGAFYPAMKGLAKENMISINQSNCRAEPPGLAHIRDILLNQPLPVSPMGILYRLIAANILSDNQTKAAALKRIDIELIKFNQTQEDRDQQTRHPELALNTMRQELSRCVRRILLELRGGS